MTLPVTADLYAWYKADSLGLEDGVLISFWPDESGTGGPDLEQSDEARQPTLKKSKVWGDMVRFSGSQFIRSESQDSASQPNTVFVVSRPQREDVRQAATDRRTWPHSVFEYRVGPLELNINAGTSLYAGYSSFAPSFSIVTNIFDGANSEIRLDRSLLVQGDAGSSGHTGVTLGARRYIDRYFDGEIIEFILYNRRLSSAEIDEVEDYLFERHFEQAAVIPRVNDVWAWYQAESLSHLEDGASVEEWKDEGGYEKLNLRQTTEANQPTYRENQTITRMPVVRFRGAGQQYMDTDELLTSLSQPITTFVVSRPAAEDVNMHVYDRLTFPNCSFEYGPGPELLIYAGSTLREDYESLGNNFLQNTLVYDGSDSMIRLNGELLVQGDAGTFGLNGIRLGARRSIDRFFDGDIAELIVYEGRLSSSEIEEVENYLHSKYSAYDDVARFDGITIPLLYSQDLSRDIVADEARTAGGILRRDYVARKRVWQLGTRPMTMEQRNELIDHLEEINWGFGDFWLDELGTPLDTIEAYLFIDENRSVSLPDRRSLTLRVVER